MSSLFSRWEELALSCLSTDSLLLSFSSFLFFSSYLCGGRKCRGAQEPERGDLGSCFSLKRTTSCVWDRRCLAFFFSSARVIPVFKPSRRSSSLSVLQEKVRSFLDASPSGVLLDESAEDTSRRSPALSLCGGAERHQVEVSTPSYRWISKQLAGGRGRESERERQRCTRRCLCGGKGGVSDCRLSVFFFLSLRRLSPLLLGQKLGLRRRFTCTVMRNDEESMQQLKVLKPFVFYGYPTYATLRRLFLTR